MPSRWQSLLHALLNNAGLKLLALLLALLTLYAIRRETGYEVDYDVPLEVREVRADPGIAVLDQNPTTVRVRFRGSQEDLLRLDQKRIKAVVRPRSGNPDGSETEAAIEPKDIQGAGGATVVRVEPRVVKLTFDREIEKTFAVAKPQTIGSPLVGKVEIDYEPNTVLVRGPKRRLEELERYGNGELATEPVDVDGRVQSFSKTVRIVPPAGTWLSRIEPDQVTVKVGIVTRSATREWKNLPVLAALPAGFAARVAFEPAGVNVSLEGRPEVVENIGHDSIMVFVNCADLRAAGEFEMPVHVYVPPPFDVSVKAEPSLVKAIVVGAGAAPAY